MIFGHQPLSAKAVRGVVLFTVIETVVLTVWLGVLIPSIYKSPAGLLTVVVLIIGLFIEHLIATQVGQQDK